jgi:hypothetical protein
VDDTGRIVREVKVASEPEALLTVLRNPAYHFKRIGARPLAREPGFAGICAAVGPHSLAAHIGMSATLSVRRRAREPSECPLYRLPSNDFAFGSFATD